MQIIEVNTPATIKEFHRVPFTIYKNDSFWVPHLQQDIEEVFNPKANKFFRHGSAIRWVLKDDKGNLIGRVAAFVNSKEAKSFKQPTGGMGFFECINNKEAAFLLFDTCKLWLEGQGMEAMNGPINFGEKDKYWGLITNNFELAPYYCQNYNPEYYVDFFEEYGFQVYFNQYIYFREIADNQPPEYLARAERLSKNPKFSTKMYNKKEIEKFAEDFRTVYNRAWGTHNNFKGMPKVQAIALMKKLEPVIDPVLIWFAYYEDQPIGFYISLPELNEIFRYVNGNFNWWGKIKFLWHKYRKTCKGTFGVVFGVDPDFQARGVEGAIFEAYKHEILKTRYTHIIITWIGDFNPKMIRVVETLGSKRIRTMATYQKLFDANATFERAPIIGRPIK